MRSQAGAWDRGEGAEGNSTAILSLPERFAQLLFLVLGEIGRDDREMHVLPGVRDTTRPCRIVGCCTDDLRSPSRRGTMKDSGLVPSRHPNARRHNHLCRGGLTHLAQKPTP